MELNKIYQGDTLTILKTFPDESVDCIVTSPPYYGLRDYGVEGQIGLEKSLDEYLEKILAITAELKRVLKKTGTIWWNHGDSYGTGSGAGVRNGKQATNRGTQTNKDWQKNGKAPILGYEKSLLLQAHRLAIRMIDEQGWILRNTIIWHKPNVMPSSVKDRFTVDYEPVFFFTKSKERSSDIKEWLPKKLKPEEAAWLAAIVDGEGTIGIRRSRYADSKDTFQAYLTVSNSYRPLIERCIELIGLGTIKDAGAKTNFPMYRWEVTNNRAVSVIGEIYPYLLQKKEQAKVAIAIQKLADGSSYDKKLNERIRLWELCKSLNQRVTESSKLPEPNLNCYGGAEKYWFELQHEKTGKEASWEEYNKADGRRHFHKDDLGRGMQQYNPEFKSLTHPLGRTKRSVWKIPTKPYSEAHFATFPPELVETPIKAGCPPKGVVLDPFMGSGTVAYVARQLGRNWIGIELKKEYIKLAEKRLAQQVIT